jgi:hypothetical protein
MKYDDDNIERVRKELGTLDEEHREVYEHHKAQLESIIEPMLIMIRQHVQTYLPGLDGVTLVLHDQLGRVCTVLSLSETPEAMSKALAEARDMADTARVKS